jgi:replicative DNA helicase
MGRFREEDLRQYPELEPDHVRLNREVRVAGAEQLMRDSSDDPRWPCDALDKAVGSLYPTSLWILGGATGNGKTAMAMNLADSLLEQGVPWVYFPLELGAPLLTTYLAAMRQDIARYKVAEAKLTTAERDALRGEIEGFDRFDHAMHFVPGNEMDMVAILTQSRRLVEESGTRVIILDHLHYVADDEFEKEKRLRVGRQVRALKNFAEDTKTTVVCLAQQKRGDRLQKWRPPDHQQAAEAAGIERVADVMMFVHRVILPNCQKEIRAYLAGWGSPDEFEHKGRSGITLVKHRNGRPCPKTIELKYHWPTDRITDLETEPPLGDHRDAEREGMWNEGD